MPKNTLTSKNVRSRLQRKLGGKHRVCGVSFAQFATRRTFGDQSTWDVFRDFPIKKELAKRYCGSKADNVERIQRAWRCHQARITLAKKFIVLHQVAQVLAEKETKETSNTISKVSTISKPATSTQLNFESLKSQYEPEYEVCIDFDAASTAWRKDTLAADPKALRAKQKKFWAAVKRRTSPLRRSSRARKEKIPFCA